MRWLLVLGTLLLAGCSALSPTTVTVTQADGTTSGTGTSDASGTPMPSFTFAQMQSLWLCQTAKTVHDLSNNDAAITCHTSLAQAGDELTVASTGIPSHDFQSGRACCAKTQALSFKLPLHPKLAGSATYVPTRGPTGLAINGALLFGPEDADSRDVVRFTHTTTSGEPRLAVCDAHSTPQGMFHYHADANCIFWDSKGASMSTYTSSQLDASQATPILGFMFDGIPMYGSFAKDASGAVKEVTSSYRLKSGHDGMGGIADYEYVKGLGDLDECNGRVEKTIEFPDGAYVYHSTLHNGAGDLGFPYFPLCVKGVVESSDIQAPPGGGMAGMAGMQP